MPRIEKMKNVVVFNGNDGQAAQAKEFIDSLRDPERGAYKGDIVIISTQLSPEFVEWYERQGVIVFQRRITEVLDDWSFWVDIAAFEHARMSVNRKVRYSRNRERIIYKIVKNDRRERCLLLAKVFKAYAWINRSWKKQLAKEFDIWHRKHLSKLNLIPMLEDSDVAWGRVLVCDADMVFQRPVAELFDRVEEGNVYVAEEIEAMIPREEGGSPVFGSNLLVKQLFPEWSDIIDLGHTARREVNVGVFFGGRDTILKTAKKWRTLMLSSGYEKLFVCDLYDFLHEQDFFRLLRDKDKNGFVDVGLDCVYHSCHAASDDIQYANGRFSRKSNKEIPVIMHFAGGVWKEFPHISHKYLTSATEVIGQ